MDGNMSTSELFCSNGMQNPSVRYAAENAVHGTEGLSVQFADRNPGESGFTLKLRRVQKLPFSPAAAVEVDAGNEGGEGRGEAHAQIDAHKTHAEDAGEEQAQNDPHHDAVENEAEHGKCGKAYCSGNGYINKEEGGGEEHDREIAQAADGFLQRLGILVEQMDQRRRERLNQKEHHRCDNQCAADADSNGPVRAVQLVGSDVLP